MRYYLLLLLTVFTLYAKAENCPKEGKGQNGATLSAKHQALNLKKNRDIEPGTSNFDDKVKITGWLLYDFMHTNVSVASNPDITNPHRGTVWEVHPITNIEDLDADVDVDVDNNNRSDFDFITPTSGTVANSGSASASVPM